MIHVANGGAGIMTVSHRPAGFSAVTPYLLVEDAERVLAFLRDECLDLQWFVVLSDARHTVDARRHDRDVDRFCARAFITRCGH
jgi:hypothetical protein